MTNPRIWIACILALNMGCKDKQQDSSQAHAIPSGKSDSGIAASAKVPDAATVPLQDPFESNPTAAEFRAGLMAAIQSGDRDKVLGFFSDIIEFDPGHSKGKAGVAEIWGLDGTPEKLVPLGTLLSGLMSDGGCMKFEEGLDTTLTTPWYNCVPAELADQCDEAGCSLVAKSGADLHVKPEAESQPELRLAPAQVLASAEDTLCTPDFSSCRWSLVKTLDGKTGYVRREQILKEEDGMAWIVKEGGKLKIRVLKSKGIQSDDT